MLTRIAYQVELIEKYIKNQAPTLCSSEAKDRLHHDKLHNIIKLLKQTYQILPNDGVAPNLSPKYIAEILLKVFHEARTLKQINTEAGYPFPSYTKFLDRMYRWIDTETGYIHYYILHVESRKGIQLILPVAQIHDRRINAHGVCGGYVEKWARDMYLYNQELLINSKTSAMKIAAKENKIQHVLYKMPHHGIETTHFPTLIIRNSLPNLLHSAPITDEIKYLQNLQCKIWSKKSGLRFKVIRRPQYLSSIKKFSNELMTHADNHINQVSQIYLTKGISSHIVGLIKTNDHFYHFFDPNHGWYRFQQANDFIKWFSVYFHENYDFTISSILMDPSQINLPEARTALDRYPNFLEVFYAHSATIILRYSIAILRQKMTLQDIYRNINNKWRQTKNALAEENKQIKNQISNEIENELKTHTLSYYKSQLWFSDDMLLEMKKFPRHKQKTGSEDDLALLPRFFFSRTP